MGISRGEPDHPDVDSILRLGYFVQRFSPYHYRFQDAVDFWPTTGRWFDRNAPGSRRNKTAHGVRHLREYLLANYPLDFHHPGRKENQK